MPDADVDEPLVTPSAGHAELVRFLERSATAWAAVTDDIDRDTLVIFGLLEATARIWQSVHSETLARFDLNLAEWTTLGMLRISPPAFRRSPTELRRLVGHTSAGMTRILAKLGDAGLVRRATEPADGRRHDVILTRRGRTLAEESFGALHATERELLRPVDAPARAGLIHTLDELRGALRSDPQDR
jgi:DNA-binding MarR family transcriptional regulator